MPAEKYHAHASVSSSLVKMLCEKTPAHVRQHMQHPPPSSHALALGTVTHTAILEPDALEARYFPAEWPGRNTKAGKIAHEFAEDVARSEGKELIARSDFDAARRMRDSVHQHPEARLVLCKGKPEVSIFAEDPESGCQLRSREDWAPEGFDVIVDLKTCRDASPRWFGRDAFRLMYPVSAYHYRRVRAIETGREADFMWIAVESEPPYAVACYYAEPDVMLWGSQRWRAAMQTLKDCRRSGQWPAFSDQSTPLEMPAWARAELQDAIV